MSIERYEQQAFVAKLELNINPFQRSAKHITYVNKTFPIKSLRSKYLAEYRNSVHKTTFSKDLKILVKNVFFSEHYRPSWLIS